MDWLKYSGIWMGLVVNPFHWRFSWVTTDKSMWKEFPNDFVFENCVYFGPIWIRVIIDDGRW